ncbi:MAG: FliM/FliN family flagellar motor switch protein [Rhodanobacteraceae bacterium]
MNATLVEPLEYAEVAAVKPRGEVAPIIKRDMAVLGHVPVHLEVVLGQATTTVEELFRLQEGNTLELDALLDAPVSLQLNGKAVARGHLVAVGDHFGLKITEIA